MVGREIVYGVGTGDTMNLGVAARPVNSQPDAMAAEMDCPPGGAIPGGPNPRVTIRPLRPAATDRRL